MRMLVASLTTASLAVLAVPAAADPSPAPPPASALAALINRVADVDARIRSLDAAVAAKRETANRALVDLQSARDASQAASSAVKTSSTALTKASDDVAAAQRRFDAFVRALYMQGNNVGALDYLGTDDPQDVLTRAGIVDRITADQRADVERLQRARNDAANRASSARAAERQAKLSETTARTRHDAATTAITAAVGAAREQRTVRAGLLVQRQNAAAELARAKGQPTTPARPALPGRTPAADPVAPGAEPGATPGTDPGAGGSSSPDSGLQLDALRQVAGDVAQQIIAAFIAQNQRPHTDLDGNAPGGQAPAPPGGAQTGPAAIETAVNRGMSQLGVVYAWGGGDANGPTKGIRDGGVADSFGDYDKIGFDCSGLMIYAFAGVGISLPHYTGYQYTSGPQFPLAEMKRGDMIFYGPNASEHVSLYLGDGRMLEAPQSGDVVKVSPVRTDGAMPNIVRLIE